jgi:deoxyribonuclease IV
MRLGMHISIAGEICRAIDRAEELRAETIQIFASAPKRWTVKMPGPEEATLFRKRCGTAGIHPVFLHAPYLVNLGSTSPEIVRKSAESLTSYLGVAEKLGASGVVLHTGSHQGRGLDVVLAQVTEAMCQFLAEGDKNVWLIIENCAGMGNGIGANFYEVGRLVHDMKNSRIKICLDTQHAFAADYDLTSAQGLDEMLAEFNREIGLERLVVVQPTIPKCPAVPGQTAMRILGKGI